ncbi:type II toxin-antitoxin system RelE/ParE family toxin [Ramlibacter sp.]|uniref:type II toxin-antitoxin system RelE/ParE family toxin n=1 Tax=Ramlibacter sp. TaxID=1917967 RepID=UPI0035B2408C
MLPIVWRARARENLAEIIRYIARHDPAAARRIKTLIEQAVVPLAEHPYLFRSGRVAGTREVVAHPNYIVVYQVATDRIEVVQGLHARQRYP